MPEAYRKGLATGVILEDDPQIIPDNESESHSLAMPGPAPTTNLWTSDRGKNAMNGLASGSRRETAVSSHGRSPALSHQTRLATGRAASLFATGDGSPQQYAGMNGATSAGHTATMRGRAIPVFLPSSAGRGNTGASRLAGGGMRARWRSHVPLLAVLALTIALSVACGGVADTDAAAGDRTTTPSPIATLDMPPATMAAEPTSTPPIDRERDGAAGLREFARQVQAALDTTDPTFFRQRIRGTDTTCTPADLERKGPDGRSVCTTAGATYRGFLSGRWRSEWETLPVEDALASLMAIVETAEPTAQDMFGTGGARVYALNLAPGEYRIIATALALRPATDPHVGPTRVAFSLTAAFDGGRWQFTSLLTAQVLGEDLLLPGTDFTVRLTGWELYRP